jgi:hypothetical protein
MTDRFQVLREFHPTSSEPTAAWVVADMELKRAGRPFGEWAMSVYAPNEKVGADALARLLNRGRATNPDA